MRVTPIRGLGAAEDALHLEKLTIVSVSAASAGGPIDHWSDQSILLKERIGRSGIAKNTVQFHGEIADSISPALFSFTWLMGCAHASFVSEIGTVFVQPNIQTATFWQHFSCSWEGEVPSHSLLYVGDQSAARKDLP